MSAVADRFGLWGPWRKERILGRFRSFRGIHGRGDVSLAQSSRRHSTIRFSRLPLCKILHDFLRRNPERDVLVLLVYPHGRGEGISQFLFRVSTPNSGETGEAVLKRIPQPEPKGILPSKFSRPCMQRSKKLLTRMEAGFTSPFVPEFQSSPVAGPAGGTRGEDSSRAFI